MAAVPGRNRRVWLLAGAWGLALATAGAAEAGTAFLSGTGSHLSVPVKSLKEIRFHSTVRQRYDFSCGSAAIATLLRYHYGHPISEREVFVAMYERGDQARIQQEGFSLFDMKRYLEGAGFRADGFRIGIDRLAAIGVPGIALTAVNGYRHFVVVKGVRGDELLVADPALGLRLMKRAEFEAGWNGIFFLVRNHADKGRAAFNASSDWALLGRAPTEALAERSLAAFTLELPQ